MEILHACMEVLHACMDILHACMEVLHACIGAAWNLSGRFRAGCVLQSRRQGDREPAEP